MSGLKVYLANVCMLLSRQWDTLPLVDSSLVNSREFFVTVVKHHASLNIRV